MLPPSNPGAVPFAPVGSDGGPRARLEQEAAEIIGRARREAADLLRHASAEAESMIRRAEERAATVEAQGEALREQARRELVQAQERALQLRAEAQRTADAIVQRATARARTETDELLHEARLQLARAVAEVQEAEVAAKRIRAAMPALDVIDIRNPAAPVVTRVVEAPPVDAVVEAAPAPTTTAVTTAAVAVEAMSPGELRQWIEEMSDDRVDSLIAGAVAAAVRKAFRPTVVRAGRYTFLR